MSVMALLKQHLPEWPGFRPAEWFRKRREAASGDERVSTRAGPRASWASTPR